MSRLLEFAQAIEDELTDLKMQIESVNCHTHQVEEALQREKAKNRAVAAMLREIATRIEREEI